MTLAPVKATPSDVSRLSFAQDALTGALAMFSPWAPDPVAARQAFYLAWTASCDGARTDVASKVSSKIYPLALAAIAKRAVAFDQELAKSPRQAAVCAAWRSIFGDVFETAAASVDETSRLALAARGPIWLVEDTKQRAPPSREACFDAARDVFSRRGTAYLGHVAACLPSDSHIFTTCAQTTRSVAAQAIGSLVSFLDDRKSIVQQFQGSFPGALPARERVSLAVQFALWNSSATPATLSGLARLGTGLVDAFSATLAASCAPSAGLRKILPDWASPLAPGSLNEKDAIFLLLVTPEANFDLCARAVAHLTHPTVGILHAGLARFASLRADLGQNGLEALAGVAHALAATQPADLLLPSMRGARAGSARIIGLNAFELCLRSGMERKSFNRPHEVQVLSSLMRAIISAGYDASNEPNPAASTQLKMRLSKHVEAKRWVAILDAVELEALLVVPAPSSRTKKARL